ncbi:acetate/propionate family kinase [Gilvimarinus sp. F26214L]|uniref:acetate/propionate family kinase n=1 Tax=Gilvimarinus sp. DZF01 TaxID=3461371 RepID=UPI004045989D
MEAPILVVNCGSSSLKLALFSPELKKLRSALAERLGRDRPYARVTGDVGTEVTFELSPPGDHKSAFAQLVAHLREAGLLDRSPVAIGHRVVHGGETFREAARIDADVLGSIKGCEALAPLHNPVNLAGIEAASALFPEAPQVVVFDTAFHQTLPPHAYLYALPRRFYEEWGVRRYGFHGTSHAYMASEAARLLGKPLEETSIVSAHLGNGCSVCAVSKGRSVDTSMGLTPLEGLVMGTRSGDIDPGLFDFLDSKGMSARELHRILNQESGLLGLSGRSNDMRTLAGLAEDGHEASALAIDIFCFRLAKYVAAMMASLDNLDALVFTGGIGENSPLVRRKTVARLKLLGFALDARANDHHGRESEARIHSPNSRFPVLVIPTDEEKVIAQEALAASS